MSPQDAGTCDGSPGILFHLTWRQGACPVSRWPAKGPADGGIGEVWAKGTDAMAT